MYSALGMGAPALLYGQYSLDTCLQNDIGGLDLAFGYEAVARAQALPGNAAEVRRLLALTTTAAEAIADEGDRQYVLAELATVTIG